MGEIKPTITVQLSLAWALKLGIVDQEYVARHEPLIGNERASDGVDAFATWPPGRSAGHGCSGSHGSRVWRYEAGGFCWPGSGVGSTDIAAIRHLLMSDQLQHAAAGCVEIRALSDYERPQPTMAQYDQLLSGSAIEGQP